MVIDFLLINKIIVILISVIGIWLAFWVLFSDRKSKINQIFFLLVIFLPLRIIFAYFAIFSKESHLSLLFTRLNFGTICFLIIFAYFFSIYFSKESKRYPILDKIIVFTWLLFCYLSVFTDLIVKDVNFKKWDFGIIFGKGINYFYLVAVISTFLVLFNLFREYFTLSKQNKLRIQYFLIGTSLSVFFNIIFNILAPAILETNKYVLFGEYSTIFLLGFTGYAIIKRELFGIKVILTQLLVAASAVLLLIQAIFSKTLFEFSWRITFFVIFLIFGYFMTRSVLKEIEQRRKIEKITDQLRELNRTLEVKVKQRTKELQERVDELNRWYKLTVGRELRMVELKKEIKKLKERKEEKEKNNSSKFKREGN